MGEGEKICRQTFQDYFDSSKLESFKFSNQNVLLLYQQNKDTVWDQDWKELLLITIPLSLHLRISSFPKVWQAVFGKSPFLPRMKLYCANCAFLIFLFNVQPGSRSMSTMNLASWNCCRTYLNSENSSDLKENYILILNNFI